jgi:hypothetical protein
MGLFIARDEKCGKEKKNVLDNWNDVNSILWSDSIGGNLPCIVESGI